MGLLLALLLAGSSGCGILNSWFGPVYITYERHGHLKPSYSNESSERVCVARS